MQKGKGYCSGLGRSAVTLLLIFALPQGRCRAADSWSEGMGGVRIPVRDHPAAHDRSGGYLLALVSAACPFSIPDLYRSKASISLVRDRCSAGMYWERTGISGYSRDLIGASAGLAMPGGFIHAAALLRADSHSVAGYGRDTGISVACSMSLELSPALILEIEACGRPREGPAHATARMGGRNAFLLMTLGTDGRRGRVARAGGSIGVTDRLSFLAGYDLETGEVSGGMAVSAHLPAAVSWSSHPVLGSTFSVSVGAVR